MQHIINIATIETELDYHAREKNERNISQLSKILGIIYYNVFIILLCCQDKQIIKEGFFKFD